MAKKNMVAGLIISFFLPGLGLIEAGEIVKALIIFIVFLILAAITWFICPYNGILNVIVWVYGLYATYKSIENINRNS